MRLKIEVPDCRRDPGAFHEWRIQPDISNLPGGRMVLCIVCGYVRFRWKEKPRPG